MISLNLSQSRQLEKHILSGKEHAKIFFLQMCYKHCSTTAWYAPTAPKLIEVRYDGKDYTFENYKLNSGLKDYEGACITLTRMTDANKRERIVVTDQTEVTEIYQQLLNNMQKYGKEPWSLYEKTWKVEASRLARQKNYPQHG